MDPQKTMAGRGVRHRQGEGQDGRKRRLPIIRKAAASKVTTMVSAAAAAAGKQASQPATDGLAGAVPELLAESEARRKCSLAGVGALHCCTSAASTASENRTRLCPPQAACNTAVSIFNGDFNSWCPFHVESAWMRDVERCPDAAPPASQLSRLESIRLEGQRGKPLAAYGRVTSLALLLPFCMRMVMTVHILAALPSDRRREPNACPVRLSTIFNEDRFLHVLALVAY
ncbi:hypothetical protein AXG93_4145s1000 [Marchantia polymorpha subsp. ruderalis]|uniref:Uncharacterized protein n=1 Tax=Marchantia polymorpha subsp. ruderalis TaxID=1480154 RepID=A0A176WP45_MARPO|nr:hypothetical protein AXG93_4145s1000 [Marchantia polymorpha subsp. ruderalis]